MSVTFACPRRLVGEVPECGEGELERNVEVVLHHPVPHDREQLLHVARVGAQLARLLGGDLGRQDGADRHRHPEHEEDLISSDIPSSSDYLRFEVRCVK